MAARNKMDHNVKGPLDKRLGASGYPATVAVENVSAGYHTLAEAFSGWRNSPPHKANMLKNGVTKLGIAASLCSKHQIQGVLDADPCINLKQVRLRLDASQGGKLGVILASISPIDAVANCRHGAGLLPTD